MTLQEWHKTEGRTQTWAARQVGVPIWTYNKCTTDGASLRTNTAKQLSASRLARCL